MLLFQVRYAWPDILKIMLCACVPVRPALLPGKNAHSFYEFPGFHHFKMFVIPYMKQENNSVN